MLFAKLLTFFLQVQSSWQTCLVCSGKSFFAVTASYATQGYYMQADILEQIFWNGMGNWAILAYTCAAVAGLVGVAIGMPPKRYLWFFIGPAVYHWLVANPYQTFGTQWVAGLEDRNQAEVWKLTKTGLDSSNYGKRYGIITTPDNGPNFPAEVSDFFAWYDSVISDTVVQLVEFTGATEIEGPLSFGNIGAADLISGLKWRYLEDLINVRTRNPNLRNAMGWFFGGNCGKLLMSDAINPQQFVQAANSSGLPDPNFSFFGSTLLGVPVPPDLTAVNTLLRSQETSSYFINDIAKNSSTGYLAGSGIGLVLAQVSAVYNYEKGINCADYFNVVMHGLRYEATQAVKMMYSSLPSDILGTDSMLILDYLLHGWDLEVEAPLIVAGIPVPGTGGVIDTPEEAEMFFVNFALAHLFKNEMKIAVAKYIPDPGKSSSTELIGFAETSASKLTQRSKFAEVYNWALMIPQFQGFLLYLLAMVYPFACMLVLIPGWHKALFTWMSFWLWVKLWDVGFAIVMTLERSVWATLGNSVDAKLVNTTIWEMTSVNDFAAITTPVVGGRDFTVLPYFAPLNSDTDMIHLFDKALYLLFNSDYELANSYYIFIMAALYMAVPAVLGQLVLMGKNGVANAFTSAVSSIGEGTSKNAGGMSADQWKRAGDEQRELGNMAQQASSLGQTGSLYSKALGLETQSAEAGWNRSLADAQSQSLGKRLSNLESQRDANTGAIDQANSDQTFGLTAGKALGQISSNVAKLFGAGAGATAIGDSVSRMIGGALGADDPAAAGTGAATGTSAVPRPGNPEPTVSPNALKRGSALAGVASGVRDLYVKSMGPQATAARQALNTDFYADKADISAVQQGLANTSMLSGFEGEVSRTQAGRTQKGAEQSMNLDAWKARQAFGNSASADQIGWGAISGSYGAGSIGTDPMGMAMMDMIGGGERNAIAQNANAFNLDSPDSKASGMFGTMKGQTAPGKEMSPEAIRAEYQGPWSMGEANGFLMAAQMNYRDEQLVSREGGIGSQLTDFSDMSKRVMAGEGFKQGDSEKNKSSTPNFGVNTVSK